MEKDPAGSMNHSFFVYSPETADGKARKGHILLHPTEARWLVVNDTGLEIARHLDEKKTVDEVVRRLVEKYEIPPDAAKRDVEFVAEQLRREHFLNVNISKPPPAFRPLKSLFLHLTQRCNLSCPHCYVSCSGNGKEDLHIDCVLRMIDELTDLGGKELTASGGEPLLHPEIRRILEYASAKLTIRLLSNGTLIDREWVAFLADKNVRVQISLDGSNPEIHDSFRGKGSFEKALEGLKNLQEVGLGSKINFCATIMRQNLHDLQNIITLAERLDVPLVRFLALRQKGSAHNQWGTIGEGMGREDHEEFFGYVSDLQSRGKCTIEVTCGLTGFLLKMPDGVAPDDLWCPAGRQIAVGTNGDAYPCALLMFDDFKLGNAYLHSLSDMVRSSEMNRFCKALFERRRIIENCRTCPWQNLCQAGCVGMVLDQKDSLWETDEFCDYRKKAYEEVFNKILKIDK